MSELREGLDDRGEVLVLLLALAKLYESGAIKELMKMHVREELVRQRGRAYVAVSVDESRLH